MYIYIYIFIEGHVFISVNCRVLPSGNKVVYYYYYYTSTELCCHARQQDSNLV